MQMLNVLFIICFFIFVPNFLGSVIQINPLFNETKVVLPQNSTLSLQVQAFLLTKQKNQSMANPTINYVFQNQSTFKFSQNFSNFLLFQIREGEFLLYNFSSFIENNTFCQLPKIKINNSCLQILNSNTNFTQMNFTQLLQNSLGSIQLITQNDKIIVQNQILARTQNFKYQNQLKNNPLLQLRFFHKNFNGTGNNPNNFDWGSRLSILRRKAPRANNYTSQAFFSDKFTYKPRDISNLLGKQTNPGQKNQFNFSMLFVTFEQFVTHQIDHTPEQDGSNGKPIEYMNISVPICDKNFDINCTGDKYLVFKRSQHIINQTTGQRQQITNITSWIDGSVIYGNDITRNQLIRSYKEGKLLQSKNDERLLAGNQLFMGGDGRANQNIALTALHTLFMREHNRKCDQIKKIVPFLNDQEIFQTARNYVTGLLQKIIVQDYLPLLIGKDLYLKYFGQKKHYDISLNPNVFNEYSTTVFRFGHMMVNNVLNIVDKNEKIIQVLKLRDMFFNPSYITTSETIDNLFRGMINTFARNKHVQMSNQLRNFLIPGINQKNTLLDLFSFNVQRARDHQVPNYNSIRQAFKLQKLDHFCRINANLTQIQTMQDVYRSVNNCDPWVGICAQKPLPGSALGQLGATITAQTFYNIVNGDRYWYQFAYPDEIIQQIKRTTLRDIILRNTILTQEQVPSAKEIFYCK